ncbi:MAG: hypothetical protein HZA17_00950 [Nitrospirae bacterium]|nr:hypothetical protein [Nitrospirota bacterium]
MENASKDIIAVLQYLLPGFVSAWIFYALTSYPKPSQFERIVQALIFTIFVQAIVFVAKTTFLFIGHYYQLAIWDESSSLMWSIVCAILFGFLFSYFANNDKAHKVFRYLGITRKSSYASEWFSAFSNVTYVVLHLRDERRLYGWPTEWPSEPRNGHFLITAAAWLVGDKERPITGVENILIDAKDVKWVEFMTKTWEQQNEQKSI